MSWNTWFDAFCTLRLGHSRELCKYKKKRTRDSISPTFPLLFLSVLIPHPVELHFYDLLVLPLLDRGGEELGNFAYMNTWHGAVLIIRMTCEVLIIKVIRMAHNT